MTNVLCKLAACIGTVCLAAGCEDGPVPPEPAPADPGALVAVSFDGTVGVLLDELPEAIRDRVAQDVIDKPGDFWVARAREQLRLSSIRLTYRQFFYPDEGRFQLPLPPEPVQRFDLDPQGPTRATIDGHDMVVIGYHFHSYLVTSVDSPGVSDPDLAAVGGVWDEPFVFPVDPTLVFERTGYACMSESSLPAGTIGPENAYLAYDDTCVVEVPTAPICHFTMPGPSESCVEAVTRAVGHLEAAIHYEHVPWDEALAAEHRLGAIEQPDYPDLAVRSDALAVNHISYRYFPEDACELQEECIGAPGWRRILNFDATDENIGGKPVHIGAVNFYLVDEETEASLHGMYEFSACHQHYHFKHYGNFELEGVPNAAGYKTGFCLISTDRLMNNEQSPMNNPYADCAYQGIESGWADRYQAGLPCQWLDITDVGVTGDPVEATLSFHSNPNGFLCEGTLVTDADGKQIWEPTDFKTSDGKPVDRPKCEFFPGSEDNDVGTTPVMVSEKGSIVTSPCQKNQIGPHRNCDLSERDDTPTCTPGADVTLKCSVADPSKPQVVRICDYSFTLGQGMACSAIDAFATKVVDGQDVEVSFKCPSMRDDIELGGRYSIYAGGVWNADGDSAVTCAPAL